MGFKRRIIPFLGVVGLCLSLGLSFALVRVNSGGTWPGTWPKELESYRKASTSYHLMTGGDDSTIHAIPFTNRKEFDKAWPFLLRVRHRGGPIILQDSGYGIAGDKLVVGVHIRCAPQNARFTPPNGPPTISPGPPWPSSARLPNGNLPEFVTMDQSGNWIPAPKGKQYIRARQDIVLVCDGKVIDPARIAFPKGVKVIDYRANK